MPLKKVIFFGLAGLLLMPVTAKTQEREALTKEFTQCMQAVDLSAMKNSQWLSCYQLEYKRQDKFLNLEYQKLKAKLPPAQHTALLAGQKAWLGYRDAWCQFQGGLDVAPTSQINGVACLVDLTAEQVKKLRESF